MTDVLKLLPPFEWRGKRYPVTSRSMNFSQDSVAHKISFLNGEFVEQLGHKNFTFSYSIPMREDIAVGPFKNLFTEGLVPLVIDMRDRTPGILIDPVYGEFRCVPTSFSDEADPNKRDGVDVKIEFIHSPEFGKDDPAINDNPTGIHGLVSDAGALDEQLRIADWKQEPSPEGVTDILSAINGVGQQALGAVNRASAHLDDLAFKLGKIEATADKAENPQNWPLRNSARNLREETLRLNDHVTEDPTKKLNKVTTKAAATVSSIAHDLGITVAELIKTNAALAKSPIVAAGTVIRVKQR